MKDLVKALEKLPWIVKVLLVLLFSGGLVVLWIIDLVCVLIGKDIWWFC